MPRTLNVLYVPPGYDGPVDPMIDEVIEDEEVDTPGVKQRVVPKESDTTLDRALIGESSKTKIQDAFKEYENATTDAERVVALEKIVSNMWDVVSSEDLGSARTEPAPADTTTTDSTTTE